MREGAMFGEPEDWVGWIRLTPAVCEVDNVRLISGNAAHSPEIKLDFYAHIKARVHTQYPARNMFALEGLEG